MTNAKEEPPMSAALSLPTAVRAVTGVKSRIFDEAYCTSVSECARVGGRFLVARLAWFARHPPHCRLSAAGGRSCIRSVPFRDNLFCELILRRVILSNISANDLGGV
jgi:hypothetical protein